MPQISLNGKIALVTGAGRGIGNCLARRLADEGVAVVATSRSAAGLTELKNQIGAKGGTISILSADLSIPEGVLEVAQTSPEFYGGIDFLINNAGTSVRQPISGTTTEDWMSCMAVNATAPFILCRELIPTLRKSSSPAIVNMGSVVAHKGYAHQGAYGASKHALLGLTKVLALELQPLGIRVHMINPGAISTEMIRTMRPDLDPESLMEEDEICDWILFLLTHRGNAVLDDLRLRRAAGEAWF